MKRTIFVDGEDLNRIADILDNRKALESDGSFDKLFNKLALSNIKPLEEKKDESAEDKKEDTDSDSDSDEIDFDALRERLKNLS